MLLFPRFSEKKQMNLEEEVETVESMVQQLAARDVWDGLTVLLPNMDAVCRELQMLHLQYLMYWVILMRFRYVQAMKSTAKLQQNSLQQDFWKKQNRFLKFFQDGNQISVELRTMMNFRKIAVSISNL